MIQKEPRYQVFLELTDGSTVPWGPVAPKSWCQRVCEGVNRKLVQGFKSPLNVASAFLKHVPAN